MSDEPHLDIIPDLVGDEWRAERARQTEVSRRRCRDRLIEVLTDLDRSGPDLNGQADAILDALFVATRVDDATACPCACHPRLPETDLHDYGLDCSCRHTVEERRQRFGTWMAEMDAYWDSPEGRAITEARAAEDATLHAWLEANPDVTIASHGGMAPEQWRGTVDDHSFYFRERHDHWRIELDLRPSGRFYRAWVEGGLDDDASYEQREVETGDVIAEGATTVEGYGTTPLERARFIAGTIRAHLRRQDCDVHAHELDDLEALCGRPFNWCPACGLELYDERPADW
jgi:hypothetical protein